VQRRGSNEWTKDGIDNGSFALVRDQNGTADILMQDAARRFSIKYDGGQVIEVSDDDPRTAIVVVTYPQSGTTESFLFLLDRSG
jgi:hypothetical protein